MLQRPAAGPAAGRRAKEGPGAGGQVGLPSDSVPSAIRSKDRFDCFAVVRVMIPLHMPQKLHTKVVPEEPPPCSTALLVSRRFQNTLISVLPSLQVNAYPRAVSALGSVKDCSVFTFYEGLTVFTSAWECAEHKFSERRRAVRRDTLNRGAPRGNSAAAT